MPWSILWKGFEEQSGKWWPVIIQNYKLECRPSRWATNYSPTGFKVNFDESDHSPFPQSASPTSLTYCKMFEDFNFITIFFSSFNLSPYLYRHPPAPVMADVLRDVNRLNSRLQPHLDRYQELLRTDPAYPAEEVSRSSEEGREVNNV